MAEKYDKDEPDEQANLPQSSVAPAPQPPMSSSRNLGDTQPYRPVGKYRPLASEVPLDDPDYQQTAPYRPIQQVLAAPKKRGSLSRVLGVLALLLLLAAIAAYFLLRGGGGTGSSLAVERALPPSTLGYISISATPSESQRRAFGKMLDALRAQPGSEEAIANLVVQVRDAISSTGLPLGSATDPATLETLANYLGGNVTIAALAPSQGDLLSLKPPAGGQINLLAAYDVLTRKVLGLVDLDFSPGGGPTQGIIAELRAVKDNLDKAKVVETYNGTDIRAYTVGPLRLYFALVGGTSTAAVALSSTPVKVVIDELKANKGLKEEAAYKALSAKVPAERVGTLYLNLGEIHKSVKAVFPDYDTVTVEGKVFDKGNLLQLKGAVLVSLSGQDDGAQVDVAAEGLSVNWINWVFGFGGFSDIKMNADAHPDMSILNNVPDDSLAFLVGSDPKSIALSFLDSVQKSEPTADAQITKIVSDSLGLDLRRDILAWMSSDYVVSLPPNIGSRFQPPFLFRAPFVLAQMKVSGGDRAKAADSIKRGVEKASSGKAQPITLPDGTLYPTAASNSSSQTIIGVAKDRAILVHEQDIDAARAVAEKTLANLGKGFGTTDKWKAISGHLLPDSNLIAYLAAATLRESSERVAPDEQKADYNKTLAPFLHPIKYLLIGSASEPNKLGEMSRNHTRIFVGISK